MKVTIGVVKLVFLHLDKPSKPPGNTGKEKYSAVVLFKKGGNVEKILNEKFEEVVKEELSNSSSKWKGKRPPDAKFDKVFKDAWDTFEADWAEGFKYFTPKSEFEIPILDKDLKPLEVNDPQVYDGMLAQICVNLYTYTHDSGGKGVSSFLNSIRIFPGGKKLDLQFDPTKDYVEQDIEDEIEEGENYDDLV
jgi:hypothetical protein